VRFALFYSDRNEHHKKKDKHCDLHMASLDPPYHVERGYHDETEAYQTISFHPSYQRISIEELRLKDYREGFGGNTREPQIASGNMAARPAGASNSSFRLASIRASPDEHHK
jgi:hypothetical protein